MSPAVVDGTTSSPGGLGTIYWPLIGSWAREPSIFRCRGFWKQLEVAMVNLACRNLVSNFTVFQILKQRSKRTCRIHVCASFSAPTRCQNLFKVAGTHQWWRQCLILPCCSLWSTGCWTLVLWSCKNHVCVHSAWLVNTVFLMPENQIPQALQFIESWWERERV